jgi:hypothetical protein
MPSPIERLHTEIETIARSDSPIVTFGVNSPDGFSHAATSWFAPTEQLSLLTFSAPSRIHSIHIEACAAKGIPAVVSGGIREEGQKKSTDVHGVTFEGTAHRLHDPEAIEAALVTFLVYETFNPDEIDKYLNHPTPEVPPHGVYVIEPTLYTVMDGRLGSSNPDRIAHISWPAQ